MSVHDEAVGSVMQPLSTMTSLLRAGREAGMEDDVLYVAVHPEAFGFVIQTDIPSTSLFREVAAL